MSFPYLSDRPLALSLIVVALAGIISCGKRKPPLPPPAKVQQRAEITGFQRGDKVILSWRMPERNAPAGDVQHIRRIDIYRLADRLASPQSLTEEQFSARSVVIASIQVKDSDFGTRPMSYTDTLQFAGQPSRMRYAIRFVNASGQKAAFSNFLLIEPEPKVAAAPTALMAEVTQDSVNLTWTSPTANTDNTTPVNLAGFNVYRSESRSQAGRLLTASPINGSKFEDISFEFGKTYYYFVRAVSSSAGKGTESGETNIVEVTPKDTFAPSAPSSITIGAAPGTISLFFPPNPESDVVGYKVFRSEDQSLEKTKWTALTPTAVDKNTFQDNGVKIGTTYYYFVIAVDKFGNESEASEVVSEKAI